ncbi:SDR family oxidoreductase [Acidisphaera sp. L21]|jgi:NAD(P)-dependent dehydrogenase (short-subunit alcohol dehydrogenase family)|uniref:SDR family oxidoreductase n=1 Tax=Acidisphaera sp. L21 TaxID=1641851 RepID=UPI00131BED2E|nr:SDR family oxidoreductase [Acidisphaera sp. L21]
MFAADLLADRHVLITGGGTGLGRAIGTRYLELGASLVICGRRVPVLEATAAELRTQFPSADITTIGCDIRDPGQVDSMLDEIWQHRPLDILVNNAAGNFLAQSHRLSVRAVDAVLGIVLHGAAYCTLGVGRRWIEGGRGGTVMSVLTLSALSGAAFTVPSAMAKAGVLAMTRSLAVEWGPKGIRCVAIAPGAFPTPGANAGLAPAGLEKPPPERTIPMGRVGEYRELTDVAAFLVSNAASYVNGECIVVDGGKQWLSGSAQNDTPTLLRWSDTQWDALKPRK